MTEDDFQNEKLEEAKRHLRHTFFSSIGQAISMWGSMENILVSIASLLLNTDPDKAGLIFYSIQNMHVWLNIVDDLFSIDTVFSDKRKEWTKISDRLRGLNDMRVRIAHHTYWHRGKDDEHPTLAAAPLDTRTKSKKYEPLTPEQIVDFIETVAQISESLNNDLFGPMTKQWIALRRKRARLPNDPPQ
jgi:hypothetical protein